MKETINLFDRPIAFHRVFVNWTGSVNAALMLSQLVYWSKRTDKMWIYKTAEDWEDETGLTQKEQMTARKKLVSSGLVREKLAGLPARLHFRIRFDKFDELVRKSLSKTTSQNSETSFDKSVDTSFDKSAKLVSTNPANCHSAYTKYKPRDYIDHNKDHEHATLGGAQGSTHPSFSLGVATSIPQTKSAKFVKKFSDFTVSHRLYSGRKGSTRKGWQSETLKIWESEVAKFLEQTGDPGQLKRVMKWYFSHWREKYVPRCVTLRAFLDRFGEMEDAMERHNQDLTSTTETDGPPPKAFSIYDKSTWHLAEE